MKRKSDAVRIYSDGKIDIHRRDARFQKVLNQLKANTEINPGNKALILKFIRDCQLGKTFTARSSRKIGPARCLKYIRILQWLSKQFGKAFEDVAQDDMELLIEKLENDQVLTVKTTPYSDSTKGDIKKTIKKFWRWKDGSFSTYPPLVEWIDTNVRAPEIRALTKEEVEKLIEFTTNPRNKALLIVLFDSGARIEELLNVRLAKEHIFWKDSIGCYMIRLEYSKTRPRTISLPLSTKHLKHWLNVHPAKDNPRAQLFPVQYDNLRMILWRLGKKALGKHVNPHLFRHSSATYYANRLKNPYKLCYRYGWTMSSNMVNRYLDREGIIDEETAEVVQSEQKQSLQKENQKLREELMLLKESSIQPQGERASKDLQMGRESVGMLSMVLKLSQQQAQMSDILSKLAGKKFAFNLDRTSIPEIAKPKKLDK